MKDFFISYNQRDRAWAEWIAWTLEEGGYTTVIQAWDFRAGGNFVLDMQKAASEAERTIAVLSDTYLTSAFTAPEWAAAFVQDPTGEKGLLIPVRVKECQPTGLLRPIVYVDLVDVAEAEAQDLLLRSLSPGRTKPDQQPQFPGNVTSPSSRLKPVFPPSIPSNLPLVNPIFVGRDDELEQLHIQLQSQEAIAISAVSGMGGIGKTELAAQYALQQRDMGTYPGGICWLKAREDLGTQIVLFARSHLRLTIPEDLELPEQVTYCWHNWHPGTTLIVFDDVQQYGDIAPVLPPQRSQFRVLLTTRLTLQSPVQNFEITVLPEEKAIELLRSFAIQGNKDEDLRFLEETGDLEKQICHWLGYLPLGLELVGRYLARKPDLSLETLWQRLQDKKLEAKVLKDATLEMTASLGVAAAFELSWQDLEEPAQRLASLLSLFALAEIPWTLVEACHPEEDPETLEDVRDDSLLRLHLLERTGQGTYQLHQLLREFFAAKREQRTDTDEMKRTLCRVMFRVGRQIPQMPTLTILEHVTPAIPHLVEVATTLSPWLTDEELIEPATGLARFYEGQSAYAEALHWCQTCLTNTETRLGSDHPDVASSLNNLAGLYQLQGCYAEAEPLYVRSLSISEQQLGSTHPHVAQSLNDMARLYKSQGRYAEAEPLYVRSLTIREQQLGSTHPDVAISLNDLAALYESQGRYAEAEPLLVRSLSILEQQLGSTHPHVAQSLNNLAALYQSQGRYAEAEPLYGRSLSIREQQLGRPHPAIAQSLNHVAALYPSQGRYAEAEPLYERSISIRVQQLEATHPDIAQSFNNLARLYESQERYTEAEPLYLTALTIWFNSLGSDHPNTQTGWQNFCLFLQQVMQARQTVQLSDHPLTQDLLRQIMG
ncbi:MAG: tetratricopeptide repeat protein [Oculatellaceae cyanobacterium bins.114]|nr:tetratricopeptide repeat protein [Oculatellaceae cyanobacterium bins.114]